MTGNEPKPRTGRETHRYCCPQCFTTHYYNDVLFTRNDWFTTRCDLRQAIHCATFDPQGFPAWQKVGKSRVVRTWHGTAEKDMRILDGAVLTMRDPGGALLNLKVCPVCHSLLGQGWPILFGWDAGGMNNEIVRRLFRTAAADHAGGWHAAEQENANPLKYEYVQKKTDIAYLSVPVELEKADTKYGRTCISNCCLNAPGIVTELRLKLLPDGRVDETEAEQALSSLLENCQYSTTALNKAAVFLVVCPGTDKDPVKLLEEIDKQLLLRIRYSFTDTMVEAFTEKPQQATELLDWLLKKCEP